MKDVLLLFSVTNRIERMVERSHIQTHFYWNKAANLVVMWQFTLDNNVVLHARRDIVSGMVLGSIFFFFTSMSDLAIARARIVLTTAPQCEI